MPETSKNHHFVPRSVLRRFSSDLKQRQIYVFDKTTMRSYLSSIEKAGSENNFNTVEIRGKTLCYEDVFQNNDEECSELLNKIVNEGSLANLYLEDRMKLSEVVAVQFVRTKMTRTSPASIAAQLAVSLKDAGFDPSRVEGFSIPTEQEARKCALAALAQVDMIVHMFDQKIMFLIRNTDSRPFWISDNPVVMHNSFAYGRLGLGAKGVEVYMPISKDYALGFWCPSILLEIGRLVFSKDRETDRAIRVSILGGMEERAAITLGPLFLTFLNSRQVSCSSRFLYGPVDDFALAREIIEKNPQAKHVQSLMAVGPMGMGSPAHTNMPLGVWAVFYGRRSHHMMEVTHWNEDGVFPKFETSDLETLQRVMEDQPIEQAIIFKDQIERVGMRGVAIEVAGTGSVKQVSLNFLDEGINQIRSAVKAEIERKRTKKTVDGVGD